MGEDVEPPTPFVVFLVSVDLNPQGLLLVPHQWFMSFLASGSSVLLSVGGGNPERQTFRRERGGGSNQRSQWGRNSGECGGVSFSEEREVQVWYEVTVHREPRWTEAFYAHLHRLTESQSRTRRDPRRTRTGRRGHQESRVWTPTVESNRRTDDHTCGTIGR